jgi:cytochrome c biogenesis protein CcdA
VVAAASLVILMFALALLLAAAQERTAEALRAGAPAIKRWGGRVLVLVGAWLVALGVFADFFSDVFSV